MADTASETHTLPLAGVGRCLIWFAYTAALSAGSGALLYCYWSQLGAARAVMAVVHEFSGDVAVLLLVVYSWGHLRRTWILRRKRALSWWVGVGAATAWVLAAVTGVFGQLWTLRDSPVLWWLHAVGSFAALVIVCFHAVHGFRTQCLDTKGHP